MVDEGMPVYNVAVRAGDGALFHQDKTESKLFNKLHKGNTTKKWRRIIKEVMERPRACKVQLLVGWEGWTPVWDEMVFRLRATT